MKFIRCHIANKVLCMLMALHILNFSIDNPHTLFEHNKVDADFDEVDSIVELVLEDVLQIEDAIPENHRKTPITYKFNVKKMVWLFEEYKALQFKKTIAVNFKPAVTNTFYSHQIYNSPLLSLFSPPPEV
ncbi:hypothetical protein GR160_16780 [Flavobacterium sp. Sd200]|uniref:hypothetical protein n=1 Tax=Flavobacterium sp. Sd200 TaxID=2692211 RepID=UPI001368A0F7|nr:hypothetical protein [Flavobacterium sp. Sd200]MXN92883.1 hypothetical protein [Flavobacterium sp. Sd200]